MLQGGREQFLCRSLLQRKDKPMKNLSIDIETYSPEPLVKCGVYRYSSHLDFEILLFGYSADGGPVHVVDFTDGEKLPDDVLSALTDTSVTKWAFNA